MPGLSQYLYQICLQPGQVATNIIWTLDKATAEFVGPTNQVTVTVRFSNTTADWIKLSVTYQVNGQPASASKQIALVKVTVDPVTFANPGLPLGGNMATRVFLVNPPPPPAEPKWVTVHDPGSDCAAFTYNGTLQAAEPRKFVQSNGAGGGDALTASTKVTLTAPAEKPDALTHIQVGYIQSGFHSGSARYATTPAGGQRQVVLPTTVCIDWLSSSCSPGASDLWPWYDSSAMRKGTGSGTWSATIILKDSPSCSIPAQYNPNVPADPNSTKAIISALDLDSFLLRMGAQTTDTDLGANAHYFDEAHSPWSINFAWPVVAGTSIVTTGPPWAVPASASEISVNVVPSVTNANAPFKRWIPQMPSGSSGSSGSG